MATQTQINRLKKLETKLQPLAPVEQQRPMEIWRVSKTTPRLYRREGDTGAWIDEAEYLDLIGPPAPPAPGKQKNAPRIVEIVGDWRELEHRDRTIRNYQNSQEI